MAALYARPDAGGGGRNGLAGRSGPGLDAIVDVAQHATGCLGARMTGGGFAGCAVALVRADDADAFTAEVTDRYDFDGHTAEVWVCSPSAGASVSRP